MTTRRRFITLAPLAGAALLAACSKDPEPAAPAPAAAAPAPAPAPAATPAPAAPPEPAPAAAPAPAPAAATSTAMVDEKDPQASALGYVADATKVDAGKFKSYVPGSKCAGCAQFQGKAGDASGPCTIFQGKQVSSGGWCGAWVKKA